MRAVFETLGVQDVVAKSVGSQNPYNMVRATFDALTKECSPRMVAARRGKKVGDILPRRDQATDDKPTDAIRPSRPKPKPARAPKIDVKEPA